MPGQRYVHAFVPAALGCRHRALPEPGAALSSPGDEQGLCPAIRHAGWFPEGCGQRGEPLVPLPRCSKVHSRVGDSPSSHPVGCALVAGEQRAGRTGGFADVGELWKPQGASPVVVFNTGMAKTHPSFGGTSRLGTRSSARGSWGVPVGGQSPILGCVGRARIHSSPGGTGRASRQPWPCLEPAACRETAHPGDDLSPSPVCHRGARSSERLETGAEGGEKTRRFHKTQQNPLVPDVLPQLPCGSGSSAGARPAGAGRDHDFPAYFCRCLFLAPCFNRL